MQISVFSTETKSWREIKKRACFCVSQTAEAYDVIEYCPKGASQLPSAPWLGRGAVLFPVDMGRVLGRVNEPAGIWVEPPHHHTTQPRLPPTTPSDSHQLTSYQSLSANIITGV